MRPLASRIPLLLRRLASLSHSSHHIASSNSISKCHNRDTAARTSCYGGFAGGQVRESHEISRASSSQESAAAVAGEYAMRSEPRNDWTRDEIQAIYESPLMDLLLYGVFHLSFSLWERDMMMKIVQLPDCVMR